MKLASFALHFVLVASCLFQPYSSYGSETDFQTWATLVFQGPVQDRLRLYFEYQPRFGSNSSQLERVITRPGLTYALSESTTVTLGYAWTPAYQPKYSSEQRLWQQLSYSTQEFGATLLSRSRFEQRWIDDVSEAAFRFRQQFRIQRPIGATEETLWVVYDEFFLHLNSPTPSIQSGYDQNRLFLGINQRIQGSIRADIGYVFNHINRPLKVDRINHIGLITASVNF